MLGDLGRDTYEDRGTWADGTILFGPRDGRIYRVADTGGTPTALDIAAREGGAEGFALPRSQFLPDGRHFLVRGWSEPAVYVGSLMSRAFGKFWTTPPRSPTRRVTVLLPGRRSFRTSV